MDKTMKEAFCTYEQALKLKVLGFDWECYEFWDLDFCTDGIPMKIRKTRSKPKVCVVSERNSMLERMGSPLITAPTLACAQKWIRDIKRLSVQVSFNPGKEDWYCCIVNMDSSYNIFSKFGYMSYEKALSEGISEALKRIESSQTSSILFRHYGKCNICGKQSDTLIPIATEELVCPECIKSNKFYRKTNDETPIVT